MNEGQLISLVAVIGSLILVGSGLRQRRLGIRKTFGMAMIWTGIIGIVALVFGSMQ